MEEGVADKAAKPPLVVVVPDPNTGPLDGVLAAPKMGAAGAANVCGVCGAPKTPGVEVCPKTLPPVLEPPPRVDG